jgi:hypothetical protein
VEARENPQREDEEQKSQLTFFFEADFLVANFTTLKSHGVNYWQGVGASAVGWAIA